MRLIDADALIMALRLEYPMMPMFKENQEEWEIKTEGYRKAEEVIRNAPTIEPKRGEWIEFDTKWGRSLYYCTNCMETSEVPTVFGNPLYDFCPNCGADMRKREGE